MNVNELLFHLMRSNSRFNATITQRLRCGMGLNIDYCDIYDDDDRPQVYVSNLRKARKTHKCYECGNTINKGEKYEYVSSIYDGIPSNFKTCFLCYDAKNYVRSFVKCFRFSHGSLFDDIKYCIDFYHHESSELWWNTMRKLVLINRRTIARMKLLTSPR